jgi:hypothetical protein
MKRAVAAIIPGSRLAAFGAREIANGWRWRDAQGRFHAPKQMATRHLFHTFRMIWNNHMPAEARVGTVRLYRFGGFYNRAYLSEAIVTIGHELCAREDLDPEWAAQLRLMAQWFATFSEPDEPHLEAPRLALEARS